MSVSGRVVALTLLLVAAGAWSAAPVSAAAECRLPGSWSQTTQDVGSTVWTIEANGEAQEQGIGNASGRGDLQGDVLTIDWTTSNGYAGVYRWTLDAACRGTGTLTFTKVGAGDDRAGKSYPSTVTGPAPVESPDGCGSPRAHTSAVNEVRAVAVRPGVQFHKAGTPEDDWREVCQDTVLQQGDEISCDPDGAVTLQFADNSTVVVRNTTQLKIASFFTEGGVVKTEILLRMGEVAAQVHKSEATRSDFRIKTPNLAGGIVRGTDFSVFYDPGSRTSLWTVREGVVEVDPGKAGLPTRQVPAGREVEVTPTSITKIVRAGSAGARGGVTRRAAVAKVLTAVAKADNCGATTPRLNAYAVKPAKRGWSVAVKVIGKLEGTSKWTVRGTRVTPRNALAKRLGRGCR